MKVREERGERRGTLSSGRGGLAGLVVGGRGRGSCWGADGSAGGVEGAGSEGEGCRGGGSAARRLSGGQG